MPESRSLSELTRQIAPPTKNGHAPPPTESRKSSQSVNPVRVRAGINQVAAPRGTTRRARPPAADRSRSFPLSLSRLLARLSRLALAGSTAAAAGANASRRGAGGPPSFPRSLARRPRRRGAPDPRGGPADLPPAGKERGPLRSCFRRHAPGPPAGAGLALAPHGRPGLTRPPGPAEKRTGKRSPAAGDGRARGERDLETGATPRSETLSRGGTLRSGRGTRQENRHGLRRPEGGGEAGGRPRPPHPDGSGAGRAALLRARPLGRAQPPVVFSFLLLLLLASPRFPAVSLGCHPAGLLLAAGTRRAPKRGQRRRLAHNEMGTPAARGAARPSHSWIRSGEPWGTDRAGGQTSRHGEATRPEAAAAAALGPSGRAPHLANDGKRTGEEAARA
ncbi:collagen alpha-1(I) chain-like [Gallus gallus]|uniref:collagen alpha-1(I) chain-like n=1 Tax=Gallus gallus TaxID=9031 RepID=UPI001F030F70|nr:collagen alpha-1(I) chain-like [Gallus gallus]